MESIIKLMLIMTIMKISINCMREFRTFLQVLEVTRCYNNFLSFQCICTRKKLLDLSQLAINYMKMPLWNGTR